MDNKVQDLEADVLKLHTTLNDIDKNIKEISTNVNDWDNFQLKEPLDILSVKAIQNQITIPISTIFSGSTPATSTNYGFYFIADRSYVITSIVITYSTASSSGTFKVVKAPSGTAIGSGTDVMSSTLSTSVSANINYTASLNNGDSITLKQGDRLGIVSGGTLTSLANLVVQTNLKQI